MLSDDNVLKLKEKIEKIGKPLKDRDVRIYRGILTGYNEAFIIDTETRNRILNACRSKEERKITEDLIKPVLRGRDIGRYCYKWAGLWIIVIPAGWTNKYKRGQNPEKFFKLTLPALYDYLISFTNNEVRGRRKGLLYRDDQGDYWWELRPCDYYSEFEKEKIVWQRVTQQFSFCFVPGNMYVLDSMAFLIDKNLKYLLGVLNSKLIDRYVKSYVHQYADTGFLLSNQYIEKIIVPKITTLNKPIISQIESLVSQILTLKNQDCSVDTSHLESQIDQLVYELYDLTPEEIAIIEGN
ncbi:TaqI-like C-terminal specificity domain-containing protein [Thermodesulfovibrio yellowstonii]|uniref:site-specific DNA-methyltransferase (adenine-specific) n=1 Tax=Thermodesulfovibrio yellowstonii TaxID=28262 RepID=A0A9W6GFB6_9BACT|nr:TaqI-like C-terminal specificity domain-containing protein [Thermodesulfovibrio islandicus]GLI52677.1 hypothetical protein TISLANDTSLP1_03700 [Thermodesulfovibrio islandicus]